MISHCQKCLEGAQAPGHPGAIEWAHLLLGRAYLQEGDSHCALQSFKEAADAAIALPDNQGFFSLYQVSQLSDALGGMEEAYMALGTPEI